MRQGRYFQAFILFGIGALLTACGQGNPSTAAGSAGSPAQRGTPRVGSENVALACRSNGGDVLADYKNGHLEADRVFSYSGYKITAMAYDLSGDLYVGLNNSSESRVDEYYADSPVVDRKIRDGVYDPGSMITDPHGNLYVANTAFGHRGVTWYKPDSESPLHVVADGVGLLSGLAWGDEDNWLWVADYTKNALRAYSIDDQKGTSSKAWSICDIGCNLHDRDIHGPSALSAVRGNLYVLDVPLVGSDNVREYGIHNDRDPYWAREIDTYDKFHFIEAIATDLASDVYLTESTNYCLVCEPQRYGVFEYDGGGHFSAKTEDLTNPVSMVVSSRNDGVYVAEGKSDGDVIVYKSFTFRRIGVLAKPKECDTPTKLAITPSF